MYRLGEVCGRPLDTTVTLARFILTGTMERNAAVRLLCAHAGGAICTIADRLDFGHELARTRRSGRGATSSCRAAVGVRGAPASGHRHVRDGRASAGDRACRRRVLYGSDRPPVPFELERTIGYVRDLGLPAEDERRRSWERNADALRLGVTGAAARRRGRRGRGRAERRRAGARRRRRGGRSPTRPRARPDRDAPRLRARRVRRVHRAARRRAGARLPRAGRAGGRAARRDGRGARGRRRAAPGAGGFHRARRAAVRLLHARLRGAVGMAARPRGRRGRRARHARCCLNLCRCTGYGPILAATLAAQGRGPA